MPEYTIQEGDCIDSIAYAHGLSWEKVWNDPNNSKLRGLRDPNMLLPGDKLFIPEKELRIERASTEQKHRFKRKDVPAKLHLCFIDDKRQPRADIGYTLVVNGNFIEGTTDANGCIEESIQPDTQKVILIVHPPQADQDEDSDQQVYTGPPTQQPTTMQGQQAIEKYEIQLGAIDPISETSGIQERLNNLGYDLVNSTGEMDNPTRNALRHFQSQHDIEVTGSVNDETRQKLEEVHKS